MEPLSQGIGLGNNVAGGLASQQGQAGQGAGGLQPAPEVILLKRHPGAITDANGNIMPYGYWVDDATMDPAGRHDAMVGVSRWAA